MYQKKKFSFSRDNLAWGLTAFIVICASIVFYLMLTKMPAIRDGIGTVGNVLMPIILGFVMAYLLLPVYNSIYIRLYAFSERKLSERHANSVSKGVSTLASIVLLLVVVVGLLLMAGPQVVQSIVRMIESMPSNVDKVTVFVENLLKDYPQAAELVTITIDDFEQMTLNAVQNYILPFIRDNNILGGITTGVISAVGFLFDWIIGLIVCVYVLVSKDTFSAQAKKLTYSLFSIEKANRLISDTRKIHAIFSGFISGKIIDSLIIGLISFVVLSAMNMPYAVMVSVVVGVTNIIPFFGPFIGAVPSAIIILTEDPLKSLYFLIYVIIIQQIDGNIIGPKILGNSTGLPSFWVLAAILVCGGLFGFAGMILGVPVFATIYMFVSRGVDTSLKKKKLTPDTDRYRNIRYIDPESKNYIKMASRHNSKVPKQKVDTGGKLRKSGKVFTDKGGKKVQQDGENRTNESGVEENLHE